MQIPRIHEIEPFSRILEPPLNISEVAMKESQISLSNADISNIESQSWSSEEPSKSLFMNFNEWLTEDHVNQSAQWEECNCTLR